MPLLYCGSHFSTTSMAQILFNLDKIVFADCFLYFHFFWIKPIHSKRKTFPYIFVTLFFGTLCHHLFCYLSLLPQKWCSQPPIDLYVLVLTFYSTRLARQKFYLEKNLSSESSRVKFKNGIHSTRSSFHCFVSSEFRVLVE